VSESLADPYEELLKLLPEQDQLNVDETGDEQSGGTSDSFCRD
jgi:hypothetical protein